MSSRKLPSLALAALLLLSPNLLAQSTESAMSQSISYRTIKVDGLSIFYREAGLRAVPLQV